MKLLIYLICETLLPGLVNKGKISFKRQ